MKKKRSILEGYTLLEMMLVLAIIIIIGSLGVGGFIGFRETTLVKENVEVIKQDITMAQQKAMLLERDPNDSWLYGIGIDLSELGNSSTGSTYKFFRWCSPFADFGNNVTRSRILGWDESLPIGMIINPEGNVLGSVDSIEPDSGLPSEPTEIPDIPYIPDPPALPYKNAILPVDDWTTSCTVGITSLVEITGEFADRILNAGEVTLSPDPNQDLSTLFVQYIVFESLTGRAFLYDEEGWPINYTANGSYDSSKVSDIFIFRKRSSKFDVITIYPTSGLITHHVYSSDDLASSSTGLVIIRVKGKDYKRYGILDEISSYRETSKTTL